MMPTELNFTPGQVISYTEMCLAEKASLQRGMNYRIRGEASVILMSRRTNAPYNDRIEDGGRILIYEGHNAASNHVTAPDEADQPALTPSGRPTQNGYFVRAAEEFKLHLRPAELVRVYEKLRDGIWVFNGIFKLVDTYQEQSNGRMVWKFRLEAVDELQERPEHSEELDHTRLIPSSVKQDVWKRDKGRCVLCGNDTNLHFDHIIPFSQGGTSLKAENIQLLCAKHNLTKSNRIQ